MKLKTGKIYVANEHFVMQVDGIDTFFRAGVTRVREGHEALRKAPHLFDEIDAHLEVEDASAAPGAKRGG